LDRPLRWFDYITINLYYFALTTRSQTISPLIVPLLVQQFVGEDAKGSAVGTIRLWALMAAVLTQALMGMLSDRSTHKWGRRRPFILAGTIGELIAFSLIGFTAGMEGMRGYWALFALYIFSMLSSNTAHAATQSLIPDLVPEHMRGRFSGVKALLELPLPLIFVSFVMGKLVGRGNIWGALGTLMTVMAICTVIVMFAKEKRLEKPPFKLNWRPFLRLILMTAVFTVVILGMGTLVKGFIALPLDISPQLDTILSAFTGALAMIFAVAFGVLASLRIGIGKDVQYQSSFRWWVVNRLAFLVGSNNLAIFLIYFIQERFKDLPGEKAAAPAANIAMLVGVFILLTALPSGWLADHLGKKILVAAAGLLATAGTTLILFIPSMTVLYIGGCIVGAGVGLFFPANWALGTELVPARHAGRFLGLSNLAGAGAGAIGAYIGGPIADSLGFAAPMSIFGLLFLFSTFALFGIQEKRVKSAPEG